MEKHIVKLNANKKTLLAYLKEDMNLSSRKARKLLEKGITVNDKKGYGDMKLKDGDILLMAEDTARDNIIPDKMDIPVLYEDDYILAVNKPPYMIIHPTKTHMEGTLANGIRHYFNERGIEEPVRFFNRIDMNTSGIVLIAKSSQVHSLLDRYSANTMEKKYIAVISGHLQQEEGRISLPISNEADSDGRRHISDQGSMAITDYKVLEEFEASSLVSVSIVTGKTHQIRVHFSSIGNPLLGDKLYGGEDDMIGRQALHASELSFLHPIDKKPISIRADLPNDMRLLLKRLKGEA